MSEDTKEKTIKGFKGFDKGLKCRGYQFEAGKQHIIDGAIEICRKGFHFCKNPMDVLKYYGPATSEYYEVEGSGETKDHKEDSKIAASKLTIGVSASLKTIISIGVKMFIEDAKEKSTKPTSGNYSPSATSGNSSPSATSGNCSPSATSGYYSHSATSGNYSHSATSGNYSPSATSGNYSPSATSGYYSPSATSGYYSHSATSGYYSHSETKGKNSIACAIGRESKVKSTVGNWIVASEYDNEGNVLCVKTAKVDGKKIKADKWYIVKAGKFTEAE